MSWHIPVKTEWMKTQLSHAPSMRYAENIHKMALTMKEPLALEIGSAWGLSTLAILEAGAKHLTSVDSNALTEGEKEAVANGYRDKYAWDYIRSDEFWKKNTTMFDLIYVDGSHKYEDVVNDLYQAWKFLNPKGLLMADDWDHKKNLSVDNEGLEYGVSLACWEFWRDHQKEIARVGLEGRVLWFKRV